MNRINHKYDAKNLGLNFLNTQHIVAPIPTEEENT